MTACNASLPAGKNTARGLDNTIKTYIDVNGNTNGLFITSTNVDNPVLLFISGGPGVPEVWLNEAYSDIYPNKIAEYDFDKEITLFSKCRLIYFIFPSENYQIYFTVCYWDYYGEGLSFSSDIHPEDITMERLAKDAHVVAEYLRNNNIECFYHFTEKKNIPSIKANGGLLSYKRAFDKGVKITHSKDMQSSRDIDSKLDLEDYARASFCKYLPKIEERKMAGHELVLLKISTEVAEFETTMFTDIEATHLPQNRGPLLEDLMKVNIKATQKDYCSSDDSDYLAYQAEVLIKGIIPLKYIKNIENPEIL